MCGTSDLVWAKQSGNAEGSRGRQSTEVFQCLVSKGDHSSKQLLSEQMTTREEVLAGANVQEGLLNRPSNVLLSSICDSENQSTHARKACKVVVNRGNDEDAVVRMGLQDRHVI